MGLNARMNECTINLSSQIHGIDALTFQMAELVFEPSCTRGDIFTEKNNKTLRETLSHRRYSKLSDMVNEHYADALNMPLGKFLGQRKLENDQIYRSFLNKYGDQEFSTFYIQDERALNSMGIYAYAIEERFVYVGRCRDSLKKRTNQGYGKIHPKNCYIDGQATNCRINALVTEHKDCISFWFCPLDDLAIISGIELALIDQLKPDWNIQSS